jgi:HlyD family secretion protein
MKWRIPLAVVLVAALVVVVLLALREHPSSGITASGYIEATESDLSPKVQGRLVDLRVHDGQAVRRGQIVAVLERINPALGVQQADAGVAAAEAQVAQATHAFSVASSSLGQANENYSIERSAANLEVEQAQAQLTAAQSSYEHAAIDLTRDRNLVQTGDIAQQSLDDASNAYKTAAADVAAASDALAVARANLRNIAIRRLGVSAASSQRGQSAAALDAAKAQLGQARATLGLAQNQVEETRIFAPYDGYVISHNFEDGDLVQPGSAVLTVGDLVHPYLYVYVSEIDLPKIKPGMKADVAIDGLPGHTFVGVVTEIATNAEFTPENVQTEQQRIDYLVFRIKIQFTDRSLTLKPGLPADAVIKT